MGIERWRANWAATNSNNKPVAPPCTVDLNFTTNSPAWLPFESSQANTHGSVVPLDSSFSNRTAINRSNANNNLPR